jgi:hypothetical protein
MSYQTWHTYGYGICVNNIKCNSIDKLKKLIGLTPEYEADINEWIRDCDIEDPTFEDYLEYDEDGCYGLASILKGVILEKECIEFTACDDFNGKQYLLYEPTYPWYLTEKDKEMNPDKIAEILTRYVSVLTDEMPMIDYYGVENGG